MKTKIDTYLSRFLLYRFLTACFTQYVWLKMKDEKDWRKVRVERDETEDLLVRYRYGCSYRSHWTSYNGVERWEDYR